MLGDQPDTLVRVSDVQRQILRGFDFHYRLRGSDTGNLQTPVAPGTVFEAAQLVPAVGVNTGRA